MKKSTEELLEIIKKHKDLNACLDLTASELLHTSLAAYLKKLLKEKGTTRSDAIAKSCLNPNYAYQIFSGLKKKPAREKLLALCIGMSLTVKETQQVLRIAECAQLYPRNLEDLVILYAIENHMSCDDLNIILYDMGLEPLI